MGDEVDGVFVGNRLGITLGVTDKGNIEGGDTVLELDGIAEGSVVGRAEGDAVVEIVGSNVGD